MLNVSNFEKTKQFTIIDYRRQAQNENLDSTNTNSSNKFTFKAKSFEDKQSWQSSILSCIYHDFDGSSNKKHTNNLDNVNLVDSNSNSNSITTSTSSSSNDNNQNQNNNSTLRKRIANFKRLTDFRHSLKNELRSKYILGKLR